MKKTYEGVGTAAGAVVGCIAAAILYGFTKSAFSALVGIGCIMLGGFIGSRFKKKDKKNDSKPE